VHALIIEDEALVALLIEDELLLAGFSSVEVAISADAAVAAAQRRPPSLITADFNLGSSNGVDAVQRIGAVGTTPIVFVTASDLEVQRIWADAIIVRKPFKGAELREAINRSLAAERFQH
jgi:DNA-binding response OmpR family regulator